VKVRSSTAVTGPKRLLIRSTSIMPADSTPLGDRVAQILGDDAALGALPAVLDRMVAAFGLRAAPGTAFIR
jgi:hypothetical protein